MEAALGLVGGTMGLLTGFSILSGVEIIYYLLRLFSLLTKISTNLILITITRSCIPQVLCVPQDSQSCWLWKCLLSAKELRIFDLMTEFILLCCIDVHIALVVGGPSHTYLIINRHKCSFVWYFYIIFWKVSDLLTLYDFFFFLRAFKD